MNRRILVLLDSLPIRKEVTSYSIELARRIEADIHILMLARRGAAPLVESLYSALESSGSAGRVPESSLEDFFKEIERADLEAETFARFGDPASELLKHLAESQPFLAVVWGGNEMYLKGSRTPIRHHWLERVREGIPCPLVIPSLKKKAKSGKRKHP